MDHSRFVVPPHQLRARCDPDQLPFTCNEEVRAPSGFIGQERAVAAMEFGLGVDRPGYNIFVTGLTGTGKSTVVQAHLRETAQRRVAVGKVKGIYDWCYVHNFHDPTQPRAIRLESGEGARLADDIETLLQRLLGDITAAFNNEAYQEEVRQATDAAMKRRQELIQGSERLAHQKGFAIQVSPSGIAVMPIRNGKPVDPDVLSSLSPEEQEALEKTRGEVVKQVEEALEELRRLEQETASKLAELNQRVSENTVAPPFAHLQERYSGASGVESFIESLRQYTLRNIQQLRKADDEAQETESQQPGQRTRQADPFLPFRVNLFVDNSQTDGPPVIFEDNPTYPNVFGYVERRPSFGTYVTDHTMVRPGALVRAGGGFLVIEAAQALQNPLVWPALKRALRSGEVRPEDPSDQAFPAFLPQGVRPEAIPVDVKVIMIGESDTYSLLAAYDSEFWEIFKVRADMGFEMDRTEAHIRDYAEFICGICNSRGLRHFSKPGVAAVIEQGSRMVEHQEKLSTRFGFLVDLLVEASYWAEREGSRSATEAHVQKALEQKVYRSARVADAIERLMVEGTLIVSLDGAHAGQVNGLAVYTTGDIVFGKPSRITARAFMGRQGVINIEREVRLSGQTHDKGVMILTGFLGWRFAQHVPLSVNISVAFEQSYGPVDGDSASCAELCAILSDLAGLPIRQDIAVTGSVDQMGQIQPIGGANEKIEGFYDLCKAAGKLGQAGVMIPRRNVRNLMLRPEVVEAAADGRFTVYAVDSVDEALTVLTGVESGERGPDGAYPSGSVYGRVQERLAQFAEGLLPFSRDGR